MSREVNHGTISTYKRHKCRCDECCDAKRSYEREYWRRRGRPPLGNPCEVDGVTYPTQKAAAEAYGRSKSAVTAHLTRRGDLSRLGKPRSHSKGGRKVPVKIGVREWPSRVALAEYLGQPINVVRGWLRRRNMDALIAALFAADAREAKARKVAA